MWYNLLFCVAQIAPFGFVEKLFSWKFTQRFFQQRQEDDVMWNGKKPFNDISPTHNGKYMPIMDWAKLFLISSLNVIDNNKT